MEQRHPAPVLPLRRQAQGAAIAAAVGAAFLFSALVALTPVARPAELQEQAVDPIVWEPNFDFDKVPEVEEFPADYTGMMMDDGTIQPSPCKEICRACFLGGLHGQDLETYPGGDMRSESCQLCKCQQAIPPAFDTYDKLGYCNKETCEHCDSGKLEGRPCFDCSCGLWSHRRMEAVCPHRDAVCYSCAFGSLHGISCDRCLCGYWKNGEKKEGETPFGGHDCLTTCHRCNNGLSEDPECELCFCPQYPVSKPLVPAVEEPSIEDSLGEWEHAVEEAKTVIAENNAQLQGHKVPEMPDEGPEPEPIPHFSWMDSDDPKP